MIDFTQIILLRVVILISMTLHEAMHAFASNWLGDETAKQEGRLTLNPIAHIDPFLTVLLPVLLLISGGPIFGGAKPVPFNPSRVKYGEFGAMLVGIAGPLTNLVLAFVFFGIYALVGLSPVGDILRLAVVVNLGFFIFNMIPIPPLDGSRVSYYLAPDTVRRIMASMERYGIIIILGIVVLFGSFLSSYVQAAISFFVTIFAAIFGPVL
ncbi:MAG: site-2 protease family protein [Segetibacter sp.]